MKDIDKLKNLLTEFDVGFYETTESEDPKIIGINCLEGTKNVGGFSSFYTIFEFDSDGKFLKMGAWE